MAKLNLDIPILDEFGAPVMPETNIAKTLAGTLIRSMATVESDIVKHFEWAGKLAKSGVLELDKSDSENLKTFVINNEEIFNIVKAPILSLISKLKY